jgi:hypothetical protein
MGQEKSIEASYKKPHTGVSQLTGPHFSRKPFEPGTPAHVAKAYEEAEREQLLRLLVKRWTGVAEPIDLASVHREVDELQKSLRCGFVVSIF